MGGGTTPAWSWKTGNVTNDLGRTKTIKPESMDGWMDDRCTCTWIAWNRTDRTVACVQGWNATCREPCAMGCIRWIPTSWPLGPVSKIAPPFLPSSMVLSGTERIGMIIASRPFSRTSTREERQDVASSIRVPTCVRLACIPGLSLHLQNASDRSHAPFRLDRTGYPAGSIGDPTPFEPGDLLDWSRSDIRVQSRRTFDRVPGVDQGRRWFATKPSTSRKQEQYDTENNCTGILHCTTQAVAATC